MRSGIGCFGLHLQGKNVKFYDADFCNILTINQTTNEMSMDQLLRHLNTQLKSQNFDGPLLEKPHYINEMLQIDNIIGSTPVFIRFNSFSNALKALEIFQMPPFRNVKYSF